MMMTLRWSNQWNTLRNRFRRRDRTETTPVETTSQAEVSPFEIDPDDPLLPVLTEADGVVNVATLELDSPALAAMKAANMQLAIPLVSQGTLTGVIVLGPRRDDQHYTRADRRLLGLLGTQVAPAMRVAQLVRRQQAEARERERFEQELRVARLIQQTLLPTSTPDVAGWKVMAHYQPARAVGGDFYDFYYFDDGRIGLVIGDVTDKGVPAALVMATTRAVLRSTARRTPSPGAILEHANELLHPDMPSKMFVTCFCGILDPTTGRMRFANAGHDIPYRRTRNEVTELRATGMPLGLLPGMHYDEYDVTLTPGDTVVFYSDGLVEAHDPDGAMFGFPRLRDLMGSFSGRKQLIPFLLDSLETFTGDGWEQEDDVTLVTLEYDGIPRDTSHTESHHESFSA